MIPRLLDDIEPGTRLLDLGCGRGTLMLRLGEAVSDLRLTGIEREPFRAVAASRTSSAPVIIGDAGFVPLRSESFDIVIIVKALHHMPGEVRSRCLLEAQRVLRPQGRLLVVEKARPRSLLGRLSLSLQVSLGGEDREVYHLFEEGLLQELAKAKFEVLTDENIGRVRLVRARPSP